MGAEILSTRHWARRDIMTRRIIYYRLVMARHHTAAAMSYLIRDTVAATT